MKYGNSVVADLIVERERLVRPYNAAVVSAYGAGCISNAERGEGVLAESCMSVSCLRLTCLMSSMLNRLKMKRLETLSASMTVFHAPAFVNNTDVPSKLVVAVL
jgi:hypothetical protein